MYVVYIFFGSWQTKAQCVATSGPAGDPLSGDKML